MLQRTKLLFVLLFSTLVVVFSYAQSLAENEVTREDETGSWGWEPTMKSALEAAFSFFGSGRGDSDTSDDQGTTEHRVDDYREIKLNSIKNLKLWLYMWPLEDARFVGFVGICFTIMAFFGNLVTQYNHEEESLDEEMAHGNEVHKFSLTALHLLEHENPKWLDQEFREQVMNLLQNEMSRAFEEQENAVIVDLALVLQYFETVVRPMMKEKEEEKASFGKQKNNIDLDEIIRARAIQIQTLLLHGPESSKMVLLEHDDYLLVKDVLTGTLIICIRYGPEEYVHLCKAVAAMTNSNLKLARLNEGVQTLPLLFPRVKRIEQHLLEGELGQVVAQNKTFKVVFAGHGLSGTLAYLLTLLAHTNDVFDPVLFGRKPEAYSFGAIPAVRSNIDEEELPIHNFACASDIWPRLSVRNVVSMDNFLTEMTNNFDPSERLEAVLKDNIPSSLRTVLTKLFNGKCGCLFNPKEETIEGMYFPGTVYLLTGRGVQITDGIGFAQSPLIVSGHKILTDHTLAAYGNALRENE